MNWLVRPALAGVCKYESLIDGTLSLYDVRFLNDALDVKAENERRMMEAARRDER